jgi:hypothetical protein
MRMRGDWHMTRLTGQICPTCDRGHINWGGIFICPVEVQVLIIVRHATVAAANALEVHAMSRNDGVTIRKPPQGVRGIRSAPIKSSKLPGYDKPISVAVSVEELRQRALDKQRRDSAALAELESKSRQ